MNTTQRVQPNMPRVNILVVDDTPANLTLLVRMLSGQGYKVRVAPSGKLALASIESSPPDLILLDVSMPEIDGYTLCRQLKANPSTCDIPVIFISALDSPLDKVNAFTVGGVDYITKPFELIEVLARIENQLRLRKFQVQLQTQNAQLQLLLTTTQAINEATDVKSALRVVLQTVCQTIGWDFGEAWVLNSENPIHIPTFFCEACYYCEDLPLTDLSPRDQTCGLIASDELPRQIWALKQSIWIEDINQHPTPIPSLFVKTLCLKAAFGIPIQFDNQILAVLIFFCKKRMPVDARSLQLVSAVATQLGSMIQRKRAEAALRQAYQELERLAHLDGLTQVANRRRFDEYLAQEWKRSAREGQPISLVMFDVDYFKHYNDCYGHQLGDDCLKQIAYAASLALKRPADLMARYGGEEFAVILPNTDAEGAIAVAQAIQQDVRRLQIPHAQSQIGDRVTLSLGVSSMIPISNTTSDDLVAAADEALYAAKSQGRDRIVLHHFPLEQTRSSLDSHPTLEAS